MIAIVEPQPIALTPSPFTITVDTREQTPYTFASPLRVGRHTYTVRHATGTLTSGDYSLAGHEHAVAVERKSLADLYGTLGKGRARFVRELERLAAYTFAAVVVEAELSTVMGSPPTRSRLSPVSVVASIVAWQQRHPRIHWWFVPGRAVGEAITARILERYWRELQTKAGQ